jgi:DNA-binding Xre family transcriptional regulator
VNDKEPPVRRSAGMRGTPGNGDSDHPPLPATRAGPLTDISPRRAHTHAVGESRSNAEISRQPSARSAPNASSERSAPKPKVLMGEVAAPRGIEIGRQRDAFRASMIARRLRPTEWARAAGVAPGEILAFLTGKARSIAPGTLEKLARAANCSAEDLLR